MVVFVAVAVKRTKKTRQVHRFRHTPSAQVKGRNDAVQARVDVAEGAKKVRSRHGAGTQFRQRTDS